MANKKYQISKQTETPETETQLTNPETLNEIVEPEPAYNGVAVLIGKTAIDTGIRVKDINGRQVTVFEGTITDKNGKSMEITCYDENLAKDLSILKVSNDVDTMLGIRKAVALMHLKDDDNYKKVSAEFKSFGDCASQFGIKPDTANGYVKVAKYFLNVDGENITFKSDVFKGASISNLTEILSLVKEDAEDPIADIVNYVINGDLHITASLNCVKNDMASIKSTLGKGADPNKGKGNGKNKGKGKDEPKTAREVLDDLLAKVQDIEDPDKKTKAVDLIKELSECFG